MSGGLDIAWFGSSLVSAYWNGAATYYRGLIRALAARGHRVEFFEPDAFDRQRHRDMADPHWASVTLYEPTESAAARCLERASRADLVIKSSGVGVLDAFLEVEIAGLQGPSTRTIYWDVDAPATLARLAADPTDPLREQIPRYDMVLTYGGGPPVVERFLALGARACIPVYNALDPSTHHPVAPRPAFEASLSFLGNRLPDREARVESFFFTPARMLPFHHFVLGGNGWETSYPELPNLRVAGHVYTRDHNAFNVSALAVLNVCRESMATNGHSPATRLFEAAGAAACIVTDAWEGVEAFLEPDQEVLVAHDGVEVAEIIASLPRSRARAIGLAARRRVMAEHTYDDRARLVEGLLLGVDWPGRREPGSGPRPRVEGARP